MEFDNKLKMTVVITLKSMDDVPEKTHSMKSATQSQAINKAIALLLADEDGYDVADVYGTNSGTEVNLSNHVDMNHIVTLKKPTAKKPWHRIRID